MLFMFIISCGFSPEDNDVNGYLVCPCEDPANKEQQQQQQNSEKIEHIKKVLAESKQQQQQQQVVIVKDKECPSCKDCSNCNFKKCPADSNSKCKKKKFPTSCSSSEVNENKCHSNNVIVNNNIVGCC